MPEVHFPRTNALKLFEKPLVAPNEALLASETKRRSPALASTGEFGKDWRAREVRATALIKLLEYQGEEVEYVALSTPPQNLEGGIEVNVIYREPARCYSAKGEPRFLATPVRALDGLWGQVFPGSSQRHISTNLLSLAGTDKT